MNITELANAFQSDKGTLWGPPHRYSLVYDLIFYPLRDRAINFLEIGLARGGPEVGGPADRKVLSPSIQMWLQYFPRAKIFGFDISDFSFMENDRFAFFRGDSGKGQDFERMIAATPLFDVVIDDASHASYHQQMAFRHLWPRLAGGGLYVIEDLHWQSPFFEDTLPKVPKTADFMNIWLASDQEIDCEILPHDFMRTVKGQVQVYAGFPSFNENPCATKLIVIRKIDGVGNVVVGR